jgi:hypothetical protein
LAGDRHPAEVDLELDVARVGLLEQDVEQRPAVDERELDVVVVKKKYSLSAIRSRTVNT